MKRNLFIWLFFFCIAIVTKIVGNKLFGGFFSASKAYSWDQIYEDLPFTIFYSILGGFGGLIALKLDKKDRENKKEPKS